MEMQAARGRNVLHLTQAGVQGWQVKPGTAPGTTWHTMSLLAAMCVDKGGE